MASSSSESSFEDDAAVAISTINAMVAMIDSCEEGKDKRKIDHRLLPRPKRKQWRHAEALHCIQRDYLGFPNSPLPPMFDGKEFETMFRISRSRFQRLMEDIGNSDNAFYSLKTDCFDRKVSSLEARLLLPLKTLAYGVPPHTFTDYFQMSKTFSRECCEEFDKAIISLYQEEYLRCPTEDDLKAIVKLHKARHKVNGMFGSLDCSHTYWKNCPKAWQGSYKGKENKPSIVLEAICDYHLWFWHVSYGYAGTLNDKSIFAMSPLLRAIVSGEFEQVEKASKTVPYKVHKEEFNQLFFLCDGIYPSYSRFIKGYKEPTTELEKSFTEWQESARKDIERAFGVLQAKFQWIARPIHLHKLNDISNRVGTCLILHNMCVSDRVMEGDVRATYNPAHSLDEDLPPVVEVPEDRARLQAHGDRDGDTHEYANPSAASVVNLPPHVQALMTRKDRWKQLDAPQENARLTLALMQLKSKYNH